MLREQLEEQAFYNKIATLSLFSHGRPSVLNGVGARERKKSIVSADTKALRSFAPAISMMKTAEPGAGIHPRDWRRLTFHRSSIRRVLGEGIVNPVVVIVVHMIAHGPPQMLFVQRNDMVEYLAAAASHPAFCGPVGKGCQLQVIVTLTIDLSRSSTLFIRCEVRSSNW